MSIKNFDVTAKLMIVNSLLTKNVNKNKFNLVINYS